MKKNRILNLFACALLAAQAAPAQTSGTLPLYLDDTQPLEARVEDALGRMTVEEKVRLSYAQSKFSSPGCPRLGIPELYHSDGPHGVRAEVDWNKWNYAGWNNDSCTAFPALSCLAATWNPRLAARYGQAIGQEARYREKDILLGPGVNIYRTPLGGRNFEYMGEDPYLTSALCVPYIRGVQQNGVAACVKHFALNNQEQWRDYIDVYLSDRALHEIYLPAFKAAVEQGGTWSIMGAYNKIRGTHASHNDMLLNKILKGDWHFDGCVVSDWGATHDTYEAAMNGLDIEMGTYTNGLSSESEFGYDDYYLGKAYLQMIREGRIPEEVVDEKAARVLRLIFRTAMNRQKPYGSMTTEEHYKTAYDIATEGTVLLKNRKGKNREALLPLRKEAYRRVLVVGDNATRNLLSGGGSSELKPKDYFTPLESLRAIWDDAAYEPGYVPNESLYAPQAGTPHTAADSLREEAVAKAAGADLVIFIGGLNKDYRQDCEGTDRVSYNLPYGQDDLIRALAQANKNLVVVLLDGNAVAMPWLDEVPALVQSWYLGTMTGPALADLLTGKANPSGKLPFSFPARLEDCPAHHFGTISYPGDGTRQEYKEDILVGYRWYDTKGIEPLFPFGYGLSYTTFEYGDPEISATRMAEGDSLCVSVSVRNSGSLPGKETVQLYVGDEECSLPRPKKELKGFRKIALAPGEEKTVTFTLKADALKFFDDRKQDWVAEPGKFKAYIGASSADLRGEVTFTYE